MSRFDCSEHPAKTDFADSAILGRGCSGIDHILVGTEYPYDLRDWDAAKKVEQLDIPEADKLLMLEGNTKRLLRIK